MVASNRFKFRKTLICTLVITIILFSMTLQTVSKSCKNDEEKIIEKIDKLEEKIEKLLEKIDELLEKMEDQSGKKISKTQSKIDKKHDKIVKSQEKIEELMEKLEPTPEPDPALPEANLYVDDDGGKDYSTIQDAINAANSGDIIYVYSGLYYENLFIDKTVNLVGESKENTIIDGMDKDDAIEITADYVNISGFTISNTSSSGFFSIYYGVLIKANYITIIGNIISYNEFCGVYIGTGCQYNHITSNILSNNNPDIISHGSYNNVSFNYIRMFQLWGDNNIVFKNEITHSITISGNNNDAIANKLIDATIDIYGWFTTPSDNNIYHNNFYNGGAQDLGINNMWNDGYPSGGNYWSDYTGEDLDGDGIGDTPYSFDGGQDNYPLMNQYY